jgi:uncharacterized NAD(P)/FAD-binding protein YdhS
VQQISNDEILIYLKEQEDKCNWPYIPFIKVSRKFGPKVKSNLNQLYTEGKINVHEGINDKLIIRL